MAEAIHARLVEVTSSLATYKRAWIASSQSLLAMTRARHREAIHMAEAIHTSLVEVTSSLATYERAWIASSQSLLAMTNITPSSNSPRSGFPPVS